MQKKLIKLTGLGWVDIDRNGYFEKRNCFEHNEVIGVSNYIPNTCFEYDGHTYCCGTKRFEVEEVKDHYFTYIRLIGQKWFARDNQDIKNTFGEYVQGDIIRVKIDKKKLKSDNNEPFDSFEYKDRIWRTDVLGFEVEKTKKSNIKKPECGTEGIKTIIQLTGAKWAITPRQNRSVSVLTTGSLLNVINYTENKIFCYDGEIYRCDIAGFEVKILNEDIDISKRQYEGIALESLKVEALKA